MAKNYNSFILFFSLLFLSCNNLPEVHIIPEARAQTTLKYIADSIYLKHKEETKIEKKTSSIKIKKLTIQEIYTSQIGVKEVGENRGPMVNKYLKSVGLGPGYYWCAAFVRWSFDSAKIKTTITAWSPTAENKKHFIYKNRILLEEPKPGDVVCFYYENLGRIGHTGFYDSRLNQSIYKSVEGNTSEGGSRNGDGIYIKYRSYKSTKSITRWP